MAGGDKLERLIHRATKYPDPGSKLNGLRVALSATEETIAHLSAQYRVRTRADLRRRRGVDHPDDVEMEMYILQETVTELFPRIYRGGFLVSVWSVFESAIKDIAEHTREQLRLPFGLQDLRAGDFLNQAEKFFDRTIGVKPFPDRAERKHLELLKHFRNALVHQDGNVNEIPEELRRQMPLPFQEFSDLHHKYAIPTFNYNESSLSLASSTLERLADSVYEKLHGPEPDDA